MEFYKPSGACPLNAVLLLLATGIPLTLLGGVVYAFGIVYIPLVYVSVLLTLGYSWLLGTTVGWVAMKGRLRNNRLLTVFGLLMGGMGLYTAWAWDAVARLGTEVGLLGFHPFFLWAYLNFLYENGSWSLDGGAALTGPALAAVWLTEAILVLAISVFVGRSWTANLAYCEKCQLWHEVKQGLLHLASDADAPVWQRVEEGDLGALDQLPFGVDSQGRAIRLDLSLCPECEETGYLTAQAVTYTVDEKGAVSEQARPLFAHAAIARETAAWLCEKACQAAAEAMAAEAAVEEAMAAEAALEGQDHEATAG